MENPIQTEHTQVARPFNMSASLAILKLKLKFNNAQNEICTQGKPCACYSIKKIISIINTHTHTSL